MISFNQLTAKNWVKNYSLGVYAGPEIYCVHRKKENGTKQSGTLYGVRFGYDHIYRYKMYWGIDALWARGALHGKADKDALKSIFTDMNIEARIGYTFQSKFWRCASFTPYFGAGFFWENNDYQDPSPIPVHFKNQFTYIPIGFLSQIFITPRWSLGVNFKIRYLLQTEHWVTHDPDNKDLKQMYQEKIQYRVEMPVTYFNCWNQNSLGICLVPFYEYRPYGHRANFPFDFLETNLQIYGTTLKIMVLF